MIRELRKPAPAYHLWPLASVARALARKQAETQAENRHDS
jgi:hypothetical protein